MISVILISLIFGISQKLADAQKWTATEMRSMLFINKGEGKFSASPLPWQSQLSPLKAALAKDVNRDGLPDLMLAGNFYENNVQLGRNDADFGSLLINKGGTKFVHQLLPGLSLKGQVRKLLPFPTEG